MELTQAQGQSRKTQQEFKEDRKDRKNKNASDVNNLSQIDSKNK